MLHTLQSYRIQINIISNLLLLNGSENSVDDSIINDLASTGFTMPRLQKSFYYTLYFELETLSNLNSLEHPKKNII